MIELALVKCTSVAGNYLGTWDNRSTLMKRLTDKLTVIGAVAVFTLILILFFF